LTLLTIFNIRHWCRVQALNSTLILITKKLTGVQLSLTAMKVYESAAQLYRHREPASA
ncbi:hypothetical protein L9F63_007302, partial [Diploptera punctata]